MDSTLFIESLKLFDSAADSHVSSLVAHFILGLVFYTGSNVAVNIHQSSVGDVGRIEDWQRQTVGFKAKGSPICTGHMIHGLCEPFPC